MERRIYIPTENLFIRDAIRFLVRIASLGESVMATRMLKTVEHLDRRGWSPVKSQDKPENCYPSWSFHEMAKQVEYVWKSIEKEYQGWEYIWPRQTISIEDHDDFKGMVYEGGRFSMKLDMYQSYFSDNFMELYITVKADDFDQMVESVAWRCALMPELLNAISSNLEGAEREVIDRETEVKRNFPNIQKVKQTARGGGLSAAKAKYHIDSYDIFMDGVRVAREKRDFFQAIFKQAIADKLKRVS